MTDTPQPPAEETAARPDPAPAAEETQPQAPTHSQAPSPTQGQGPAQGQAPAQAQAQPYAATHDPRRKSPFLAGLLSAMPGLGQVYVGYYQRGFVHALVVATIITLLAADAIEPLIPLASVFLGFFWLYNMIDAGRRASLYNQALAGVSDMELPEDFKVPGFRGSILGGLVIAATGVVLLLHTRFDVSLDWIEDWWPAALIAFGAYLVWKAWQERPGAEPESDEEI